MELTLSHGWLLPIFILLAAALSFLFYRKAVEKDNLNQLSSILLGLFRGVSLATIAFLLLQPLLRILTTQEERPTVIIAVDESKSMVMSKDSTKLLAEQFTEQLTQLKNRLSEKYDVVQVGVGATTSLSDSVGFSKEVSDLSSLSSWINGRYDQQTVGATILVSDGLANRGANPIYSNNATYPIYTVAVGDTAIYKDVSVTKINHNEVVFLGNKFLVRPVIKGQSARGEHEVTVKWGGETFTETIQLKSGASSATLDFLLEATKPGLQKVSVAITGYPDERNRKNNFASTYIDVLDSRQKILILGKAPHPDLGAIAKAIRSSEQYEVDVRYLKDWGKLKIQDYNLVVAAHLPEQNGNGQNVLAALQTAEIPVWLLVGDKTNWGVFNKLNGAGLNLVSKGRPDEVSGVLNPNFSLFSQLAETEKLLKNLPAIMVTSGDFKTAAGVNILLNQQIGPVVTEKPLIGYLDNSGNKRAFWLGEGYFRWSLAEFKMNGNSDVFRKLVLQTVQFLSLKEDKSQFRVKAPKQLLENQAVTFAAELYNASYEPITTEDISLTLTNERSENFNYTFSPSNQQYDLEIGTLPFGEYSYKSQTSLDGKALTKSGSFSIKEIQLEGGNLVANHNLLYQWSAQTGGAMYGLNQLDELQNKLLADQSIKPISYASIELLDLIEFEWIFYVLLILLSVEWVVRKYVGGY